MIGRLQFALLFNPILAAGLAQALGMAAGIINAFGLVAVFGGLIGACISALSERHVGGVKTSLVIAAVGGLAEPRALKQARGEKRIDIALVDGLRRSHLLELIAPA